LCTRLVLFTRLYKDARSTKHKTHKDTLAHILNFLSNTQIFKTLILKLYKKEMFRRVTRCFVSSQYVDCGWWLYNPHLLPVIIQRYSRSPIMGWALSVTVCVCLCSMCWVESIVITTTKTASRWHMWCAQTCLRIDNAWRIDLTHVQLFLQDDQNVSVHLMIIIPSSGAQRLFDHRVLTNDHTSCSVHAILKERTKLCYSWSYFLRQHGISKRLYLNYARYKYVRCSTQK
jgi:hypothetical protein